MRKWLGIILLVGMLLSPVLVHAQAPVSIGKLLVQLWPEYDQPSMLVIYDFTLAKATSLPVQMAFRIPSNASLNAVARDENGSLIKVTYDGAVTQGEWMTVTFKVTDLSIYHVEYYAPLTKEGAERQYAFIWPGDFAVGQFEVKLQQPSAARDIITEPALTDVVTGADNLIYHGIVLPGLTAGGSFNLTVKYQNDSGALTVSSLQVQPSGPISDSSLLPFSFSGALPWILGAMGGVLIAGGIVYFLRSGRPVSAKSRKRHAQTSQDDESGTDLSYCTQCGKRAQRGDGFCRACGARLG
jgi:hypothetical protein